MSQPRFLADENVPLEAIRGLQADGHDVVPVLSVCPGAPDEEVLALGAAQQRVVITFDRDFGELVFRRRLPAPPGVIFLRIHAKSPEYIHNHLTRVFAAGASLVGRFTVTTEARVRSVPLPPAASAR